VRVAPLAAILLAVALVPGASAGVDANLSIDLESLSDLQASGSANVSGELARELRARADHDDTGDIGYTEVVGTERAIEDSLEGSKRAFVLDGNSYAVEGADADVEGLRGDANTSRPFTVEPRLQATASAGEGPEHVFGVGRPLLGLAADATLSATVHAPGGFEIVDGDGFEIVDTCTAQSASAANATVTLAEREDACSDPLLPAPGSIVVPAALGAALLFGRE
jgi:hypothetical protein